MPPELLRVCLRHRFGQSILLGALVCAACLWLAACATAPQPYRKDGRSFGVTTGAFRDTWWQHYERGLSFAEGDFLPEALADFEAAVQRRDADQWRARTYGMHFADYFPHRELGIVYHRLDRPEEAIRELEASLATAPSAKAAYFLNRARRALLLRSGRDREPPRVAFAEPAATALTNVFEIPLAAEVTDDGFVAAVSINGAPLLVEPSTPRYSLQTRVSLQPGANTLRVRAVDLLGREFTAERRVFVDRSGPTMALRELPAGAPGPRRVLYLNDPSGLAAYRRNGREERVPEGTTELVLDLDSTAEPLRLEAEDRAGNVTTAELPPLQGAGRAGRRPQLASLGAPPPGAFSAPANDEDPAAPAPGERFDPSPPTLLLTGNPPDTLETFHDRFLLEGRAFDAAGVRSVTVNGTELVQHGGQRVFFSHLLGLDIGENRLVVTVVDAHGNRRTRTLLVERQVQQVRQLGARFSLAALALEPLGAVSSVGAAAGDRLLAALVEQGRFRLVERQRLAEVLTELELSAARLVEPATAPQLGRLAAADAILTGTVAETAQAVEVVTYLIDTESSALLGTYDAYDEARTLPAVYHLADRLAFKLKRDFPLLEGRVLEVSGGRLLVDLGDEDGLKPRRKLLLFRAQPAPEAAGPAGDGLLLGEATVDQVYPDHARAALHVPVTAPRPGDGVLTK